MRKLTMNHKIKQQREILNLSIREAARRAGIAAPYWLDIERGRRKPSDDVLSKIADVLNLNFGDLSMEKIKKSIHHAFSQPDSPETKISSRLVYLLAGGIVKSFSAVEATGKFPIPYLNDLQKAFDRIVLQYLFAGKKPPETIVELLAWCEKPFGKWSVKPNPEKISLLDSLLSQGTPTYFCEDIAPRESDIEAEMSEEGYLEKVRAICADKPESYTALRRALIENLVLTTREERNLRFTPPLNRVSEVLAEAFEAAPRAFSFDGKFYLCPNCGDLMLRTPQRKWRCREETCQEIFSEIGADWRKLYVNEDVLQLKRPLRRYVAVPGKSELRLENELKKLGLQVELYPYFDAYDLRLTFADGEVWAVDVKDWASPFALAKNLAEKPLSFRARATWSKAFFVFPNRRKERNPNYLKIFRRNLPWLEKDGIESLYEKDFLKTVKVRLSK